MSRARVHEVSSPISLFPFIGILLCTMGALLVVLVAVSRSARDTAQREVRTQQQPTAQQSNDGTHLKLEEIKSYRGSLEKVRSEAERKLRDEQLRLSHVEDHIRRLHDNLKSLQSAAVELHAMEQEHYDDREQAEREIERLHQLIGDSKKTIASLREAGSKESRSYAVVPYEGPNGTYRRPIYIECVKNELILQPEGVRISVDDLRPPMGPGNPLASALRAGRDHLIRINPQIGQSRDLEPYPLLLVRPDGLLAYDRARQAIDSGDFDLGFELVESDWKLKFPQADPQLAGIEQQALDQARARQVVLAAAAPRAYRNASFAVAGEFEGDDFGGDGGSGGGGPGGRPGSGPRAYVVRNKRYSDNEEFGTGGGTGNAEVDGSADGAGGAAADSGSDGSSQGGTGYESGESTASQTGGNVDGDANGLKSGPGAACAGGTIGSSGSRTPPGSGPADKNLVPDGYEMPQGASVVAGSSAPADDNQPNAGPGSRSDHDRANPAESRGKDWALRQKPARSVPVRRTIRVTVRNDQLAIIPDSAPANAAGKVVPMRGDTVESLDEFVKHVRDHIDGWGMAGNGLYWRPVVMLNVGPNGERRAGDLARLLKNSGLEIHSDETGAHAR